MEDPENFDLDEEVENDENAFGHRATAWYAVYTRKKVLRLTHLDLLQISTEWGTELLADDEFNATTEIRLGFARVPATSQIGPGYLANLVRNKPKLKTIVFHSSVNERTFLNHMWGGRIDHERRGDPSDLPHPFNDINRGNLHPAVKTLELGFTGRFYEAEYVGVAELLNSGLIRELRFHAVSEFMEFRAETRKWKAMLSNPETDRTCAVSSVVLDGSPNRYERMPMGHLWGTVRGEDGTDRRAVDFMDEFVDLLKSLLKESDVNGRRSNHLDAVSLKSIDSFAQLLFERVNELHIRRTAIFYQQNVESWNSERYRANEVQRETLWNEMRDLEKRLDAIYNPLLCARYRRLFREVIKKVTRVVLSNVHFTRLDEFKLLYPYGLNEWLHRSNVKTLVLNAIMFTYVDIFLQDATAWDEMGAPLETLEIRTNDNLTFAGLDAIVKRVAKYDASWLPPPPPSPRIPEMVYLNGPIPYLSSLKRLTIEYNVYTPVVTHEAQSAFMTLVRAVLSNPTIEEFGIRGVVYTYEFRAAMRHIGNNTTWNALKLLNFTGVRVYPPGYNNGLLTLETVQADIIGALRNVPEWIDVKYHPERRNARFENWRRVRRENATRRSIAMVSNHIIPDSAFVTQYTPPPAPGQAPPPRRVQLARTGIPGLLSGYLGVGRIGAEPRLRPPNIGRREVDVDDQYEVRNAEDDDAVFEPLANQGRVRGDEGEGDEEGEACSVQ